MKLDDSDWIANPACESPTDGERHLIANRADIEVIGEVTDAEACYSYDDFALIRLAGSYYLLNTSGCSCPSPSDTWGIVIGPVTLDEIETHLKDAGGENGYGVTARQAGEFAALVEKARAVSP